MSCGGDANGAARGVMGDKPREMTQDGAVIWYDETAFDRFEPRLFDPEWLQDEGLVTGSAPGRGSAQFLRAAGHDMVLRHYMRGGLVARVSKDLFLRVPVAASRAMREFELLDWMRGQSLPVPRPLAARFDPSGVVYRADILMERIPGALPLDQHIAQAALGEDTWREIGAVIAAMHLLGVDHSDLNVRNILLDEAGAVWLIDFDKCRRDMPDGRGQANLDRLLRSFRKLQSQQPDVHWGERQWNLLLDGYRARRG